MQTRCNIVDNKNLHKIHFCIKKNMKTKQNKNKKQKNTRQQKVIY